MYGSASDDCLETLAPCPQSPNCVCSDEDPRSSNTLRPCRDRADATQGSADGQRLLAAIATYLESRPEFRIVKRSDSGLQIEARSRLLRFVDDIEMQVRGNSVAVRSASRVGYSDLGKNRRRLEAIRRAMITQGLVQSGN